MTNIEKIILKTDDGLMISALHYQSNSKNAVILLHQYKTDKSIYDIFAKELQLKNFNVLSLDFRGHGESQGNLEKFTDEDFQKMFLDVKAADEYLKSLNSKMHVQIIGASIGANIALIFQEMNTLESVVLLSPSKNYHGIKTENANLSNIATPIFYINTISDSSKDETTELFENSSIKKDLSKIAIYKGNDHGFYILKNNLKAKEDVIEWLINHKLSKISQFKYE